MGIKFKHAVLPAAALALTGCGMAPGQHLDVYRHTSRVVPPKVPLADVTFYPVDQHLIDQLAASGPQEYIVGPQDILSITVWDHPELTIPAGEYRTPAETGILVDTDGTIFYPFAGRIKVNGLTVDQIRRHLSKSLSKYIRMPQVSVRVAQFNSQRIQVMGEVLTPRTENLTNVPLNLLDAINAAGGFNATAVNAKNVFVLRGPAANPKLYWFNANNPDSLLLAEHFTMQNRDVVFVSTAALARWNRVVSNLAPTASAVKTIHDLK